MNISSGSFSRIRNLWHNELDFCSLCGLYIGISSISPYCLRPTVHWRADQLGIIHFAWGWELFRYLFFSSNSSYFIPDFNRLNPATLWKKLSLHKTTVPDPVLRFSDFNKNWKLKIECSSYSRRKKSIYSAIGKFSKATVLIYSSCVGVTPSSIKWRHNSVWGPRPFRASPTPPPSPWRQRWIEGSSQVVRIANWPSTVFHRLVAAAIIENRSKLRGLLFDWGVCSTKGDY